jgi:hypothetical protein
MKPGWRLNLVTSALWCVAAIGSVLLALVIGGCGPTPEAQKADCMGYTWQKTMPVASSITIRHEPDWRNYPGSCKDFNIRGCAERSVLADGTHHVSILVKDPPDSYTGTCNTLKHEIDHALGLTHPEKHSYTPRDYTR